MLVQETKGNGYVLGVLALDLGLFLLAVTSWTLLPVLDGRWKVLAAVAVGVQLGRASIVAMRRAGAYRAGWLRGRTQMVASMAEASHRGMTLDQWLTSELSRDFAVLGITPEDLERGEE